MLLQSLVLKLFLKRKCLITCLVPKNIARSYSKRVKSMNIANFLSISSKKTLNDEMVGTTQENAREKM